MSTATKTNGGKTTATPTSTGNRTPAQVASTLRTTHKNFIKPFKQLAEVVSPELMTLFRGVANELLMAHADIEAWRARQKSEGTKAGAGKSTGPPGND
jgi:hypothetical protein